MQDRVITIHLLHLPPLVIQAIEEGIQVIAALALSFIGGDFIFEAHDLEQEVSHAADSDQG